MSDYQEKILTKDEQLKEYVKCGYDFEYCCETYFKIEDKRRGGYYPFELLPHQRDVFWAYEENDNVISNKYRQAGITTLSCAYIAWKLVFFENTKVAVVGNILQLAKEELFKKIVDFIGSLPDFLRPTAEKDTETLKIYDNGSQLISKAASKNGLRGFSPNYVLLDECAFFEYDYAFWTSAKPSLSMGGKIFIISTPNGRSNLFYEIFEGAKTKNNTFKYLELKWYRDTRLISDLEFVFGDERIIEHDKDKQNELIERGFKPTSSWFREQCKELLNNTQRINQEILGVFIGSGGTVIDDEDIIRQEQQNICDPKWFEGFDRNFWIWKQPEPDKKYILGADVCLGMGEDYSTICILDIDSREQVAEYQGKVPPDILGEMINLWGTMYNNAYVVVDVTGGIGAATIIKLVDLGYKNLHYSDIKDSSTKNRLVQYQKWNGIMPGFQIGINRVEMVYVLEKTFRDNEIIVRSSRLISELKTFVIINGTRADHTRSSHDDLIWALLLAIYVSQTSFGKINKGIETTKAMISNWVVVDYSDQPKLEENFGQNNKPKPPANNGSDTFFVF